MSKLMKHEDLYAIESITNPIISPNDELAVFMRTVMNEEDNTYYSYLYKIDLKTYEKQQLTYGKERISAVQWSADSNNISFISKRNQEATLHILPIHGGEARELSADLKKLTSYIWSPNNEEIFFTAKIEKDQAFGEVKEEEKLPQAYKVESMRYKLNGVGLVNTKEISQLGKINVETGEITRLVEDELDYSVAAQSHDGRWLALTKSNRQNDDDFTSQLILLDVVTQEQRSIYDLDGYAGGAAFSFDDAYVAFEVSANEPYRNAQHNEIYVYNMAEQFSWSLTAMMDLPAGDYATSDIHQGVSAPSVVWTRDNDLYFQLSSMGDVRLYYASLAGAIYPATPEEEHIYSYDLTSDGKFALLTLSTTTTIGELYMQEITTGERQQLTNFNAAFEQETLIVRPEIVQVQHEGQLVWGWFMKPANFTEGTSYPLILNIHGGPHMMYANTFVHEMQLLAAQGYAVLYMNPRGSHSYSQEFVNGCRGDYGGGDYRDLMAAVDMILEENSWIDAARLGVTGGSYGGFMTNWIIGHTERFKAALTQRSISNWVSFYGVSDIGYYFTPWQILADMTDVERLWQHSPLKYVENMTTPLMILHGELDDRCPIEQAEQLYITMKSMRKNVEFIRFPKANHDLSRTGLPNLRQQRLYAITEWFEKQL